MDPQVEAMAFLHARGLDIEPKGLAAALRAAVVSIQSLYHPKAGQEGLTAEELKVARAGGLDSRPAPDDRPDPLLSGVLDYAALVSTGFTTLQAAKRLRVSDARIRQRLHERTLLAVRSGRAWRLPIFQFADRGELPVWTEVCPALPEAVSPVAVERWLSFPHPDLVTGEEEIPLSPRQWLLEGRPAQDVARLARELA
jgi:excisionase family DNA binding protein